MVDAYAIILSTNIQLNIFRYIDGVNETFILNLSIDLKKFNFGEIECYFLVLIIMKDNSLLWTLYIRI